MPLDRRRAERDRRQSRRVPAVFAVRGEGPRPVLGQAEDLAPAGMTLRWPKDAPLAPAAAMALTFELPGTGEPIAARAQVVNERHAGGRFRRTGVRFTTLAPEHAALIARYCASRR